MLGDRRKISVAELFSLEELQVAEKKLKNGKAPGLDNVPPQAIEEFVKSDPAYLLEVLSNLI